jgi:hypothetical protein
MIEMTSNAELTVTVKLTHAEMDDMLWHFSELGNPECKRIKEITLKLLEGIRKLEVAEAEDARRDKLAHDLLAKARETPPVKPYTNNQGR